LFFARRHFIYTFFFALAAHLGLYHMKQNKPEGSLKSIVLLGSIGMYDRMLAVVVIRKVRASDILPCVA